MDKQVLIECIYPVHMYNTGVVQTH